MARPREFDEEQALLAAMQVFWRKGYDGTSIPDLLEATGLSRSSLYETFGDKAALFATIGPMRDGGVVLSGHTDVVPVAGQAWTSDPYTLRVADGRAYGQIGRASCRERV